VANDPYKYFRVEARELLEQLGSGLVGVEREGSVGSDVPRLLRLAHTLKGAARVVKQPEIADLAHEIEDRLAPFRERGRTVPGEHVEAVLGLVDAIAARVGTLIPPPDTTAAAAPDEPFRTLRTDVAEMDEMLNGIAETQAWLGPLRRTPASMRQARRLASVVGEELAALPTRTGPRVGHVGRAEKSAQDLQALLAGLERGLAGDIERVERELQQVRSAGERLRLLPISTLFSSLERAVRDVARTLGKRAAFRGEGGDIRLDGHILGALQAALVQVVRNAVAHGIEPEAERVAAGKPVEGSVVVEVARRGSRVAIACRDDGRGIDVLAVRRALQRKGMISTPEAAGPEDLLRTLLEGGITTSSAVTDTSGRGIGLDVVREVTSRLGGQATLRTQPGEGTTLELVVPVSLSSLEALVVEASGVTAAIPVEAVRQTVRVERSAIAGGRDGDSILYEGTLIPFVPLRQALGEGALPDGASPPRSAVVVGGSGGSVAFGVERLLGRDSLLVRRLPALAPVDPVVSGLSLDAEGNPQPVLDPERLIARARAAPRMAAPPRAPAAPILIVDDSLTTRMLEQSILESAGYAVELATSGEEALEKARHRRYSLFLIDVEMPGMDGFALMEHLRSDSNLRGIPTLLVTSRHAPEDRARGMQAGARAYIVKSEFDQAELVERIRGLVG
jgi:two-component system chemotaxis sensor kinase CheA